MPGHDGGTQPLRVLIVDDERNIRLTLSSCVESAGHQVTSVGTPDAALAALSRQPFELVFLDLRLGDQSGMALLPRLLAEQPGLAVIVITAYATIDTAVEAIQRGAFHYLPKPFTPAQVRQLLDQLHERRRLFSRNLELEARLAAEVPAVDLASASPAMASTLSLLQRAAQAETAVLLRGENGTGKGVLARALHAWSRRSAAPFVTINCPTLSDELLASELFGHAKGAFTGASRDQAGRVEAAQGGTLFLDEIGEISPALQAKLLRFLQEKQFERLGENRTRQADVRLVAATNRDLEADVRAGRFREDLYFRLCVIEVRVPSLRERVEDILPLAERFLAFFSAAVPRAPMQLAVSTRALLVSYPWPGNVRELRNAMERAAILWPGSVLDPAGLPSRLQAQTPTGPYLGGDFTLEEVERAHVERVLARAHSQEEAARVLGIEASTLWRKRKKWEGG